MNSHSIINKKGFGLMEAVVVTAIFAVTMTVVSTILINSLRFQRQVNAEQAVVGSARDALETLAREIRLGYIDYTEHLPQSGHELDSAVNSLFVKTSAGTIFEFTLAAGQLVAVEAGNVRPISSTDINITNLQFYVRPTSDPYWIQGCSDNGDCDPTSIPVKITGAGPTGTCAESGICVVEDVQPRVTIILRAETANPTEGKFSTVDLQTTVSARTYLR
ncbi:MAG: type II secretion system protein [Patescibacteria group bacterium]|nr:type II secretion system protein [Patescibacteria group bacterium]